MGVEAVDVILKSSGKLVLLGSLRLGLVSLKLIA